MHKNKIFIIAEAGVNHNGSLRTAKKMIDLAAAAGADCVKFQTFRAEQVISRYALKAEYQKRLTDPKESQVDMAKKLELSPEAQQELFRYCRKKKIAFLSSPFDLGSIDFLHRMGLEMLKIPSGEITNLPYLRKIAGLKKKIILSSGMSGLSEVRDALEILTKGGVKKSDITVLHCTSEYPAPYEEVNLKAMQALRKNFKVAVGYSDHTLGIEVPIAAAALGATIIEKHFTLDRGMKGPDHEASLEPGELRLMVKAIRNIEKAMGDGIKKASPSEIKNKKIARKSIVALRQIKKGEIFSRQNITVKRPANGISPMKWDSVLGRAAKRNFRQDEAIRL
jgi:N,N'-diacetyllegionaminate synthase